MMMAVDPDTCPHKVTEDGDITCPGICCCVCFFPLGLLCLMLMRDKRCAHCKKPLDGSYNSNYK